MTTTILALPGSLRAGSFNAALARAAAAVAPPGITVDVASIRDIPLYDGDLEASQGLPAAVVALKARVAAAHGLLVVTPEYNGSVPGVLKNAIDWLSRPPADIPRVFGGKPVALIGASPGPGGTRLAQAAWLPIFRQLGLAPWYGKSLYVAGAREVFDDGGEIKDDKIRRLLTDLVAGFAASVDEVRRRASAPAAP
jgi:NAD(P)H-dependent FMN reductase